jgi:hypothetical protein
VASQQKEAAMTPELVAHSVVVTNFREIFNALAALAWLIFDQAGSNKCLSGIRFESGHAIPNDSSHDAALKHKHVARPGGSLRVGLLVASQTDRQTLWSHRNSGQTSTRRAMRGYTRT